MNVPLLDLQAQYATIKDKVRAAVDGVFESQRFVLGAHVAALEEEVAKYCGVPHAIGVASGTDALLLSLKALGVGPGDSVVTVPFTFFATAGVVVNLGARPIFVDIEPAGFEMDPDALASFFERECAYSPAGKKTVHKATGTTVKAVLPVHLYGHCCDMDALDDIAVRHGLAILEDAAHALPASYKNRRIGSGATAAAFSFYATKNLTTGEGGMLTGDPELVRKARLWSLHGLSGDAYNRYNRGGSWAYEVLVPGFKCNMSDIQAAIGLQQLRKLDRFQAHRRRIVERYRALLSGCDAVQLPTERPDVVSGWNLFPLRLNLGLLSIDRDGFIGELKKRNIGSSVHFIPVHVHPYYRDKYGFGPRDFPIAYDEYLRIVTVPLSARIQEEDVADVAGAVREICAEFRR